MGTGAEPHSPRTKTKAMVQLEWKNKVIKSISAGRSWVPPAPAPPQKAPQNHGFTGAAAGQPLHCPPTLPPGALPLGCFSPAPLLTLA